MTAHGVILLLIGLLAKTSSLYTIGIIRLVVGLILLVLGMVGREVCGREHYY